MNPEGKSFPSPVTGGDPLAQVRHSLRTPLNQIIGYSEMLQEEAADLGENGFLSDLQKIHTAGGQLLALVNDALAPWKIESGKIDLDAMRHEMRTPLNLIMGYSELCQEEAQEKGQTTLISDLRKINLAAQNLLALFQTSDFPSQTELNQFTQNQVSAKNLAAMTPLDTSGGKTAEKFVKASILVVDDNDGNRDMLSRRLERLGYTVVSAENGREALEKIKETSFDLMLLDVLMPELDGYQTLEILKEDETHRHLPVIMLSALDEVDSAVRCIAIGAEDYLPKPFNPVLLRARITACLEKKWLRDQEQAFLEQLQMEREKSERMLLNIMPKSIADRLKAGESIIADDYKDSTVLFADLENFTQLSSGIPATELVHLLNDIFSGFDWLAELHGLEKIKTIGDAYMVVGGVPTPRADHAAAIAEMALEMQKVIKRFNNKPGKNYELRIGICSGPVTAGVIGRKKFIYDLWGDTVNVASRMESAGIAGKIQVTTSTYEKLKNRYAFDKRGVVDIKGKGEMTTYFLTGRLGQK